MTCIVLVVSDSGTVVMGSDSGGFDENSKEVRNEPKIFCCGNVMIGFSGNFRIGQILQFCLKDLFQQLHSNNLETIVTQIVPVLQKKLKKCGCICLENGQKTMNAELFIALYGKAYKIESNFQVSEIMHFSSIGSGNMCALGALDALNETNTDLTAHDAALIALEAAQNFTPFVVKPFTILEI